MSTFALVPRAEDPHIKALVATYAPIGRQIRRQEQLRRRLLVAVCALAVTAGVLLTWQLPLALKPGYQATATMTPEIAAELREEREQFNERLVELEAQLAIINLQRDQIDDERAELQVQGDRLEALIAAASVEQLDLEQRAQHGSKLDEEIAAMAAQREQLAERLSRFDAQGELLAVELLAVNAQRKELEAQRQKINEQQRALAQLIDRAEGLYKRAAAAGIDSALDETSAVKTEEDPLMNSFSYDVAAVNDLIVQNVKLDEMRGGFSIGDGLDVSIGFTQTGSINGIEQFHNQFTINSMAQGFSESDLLNMNSVLVQQGDGNFVSPGVIEAMGSSFGSIIQNSLDDQTIATETVLDISLHNVPGAVMGISGEQALLDSLTSYR
ncbi:MAG: hypothetical protein QNJ05_09810 [Woeseiaceae bacterium]|nr:hypothetical protein [Woeseiaceae bacterium]